MSRLRVVAGTSLEALHPITVNTGTSHSFASDVFEGEVCAYIKDFPGPDGQPLKTEYFAREDRKGITWSIQVQGRFLQPVSADDVLFGNTFDRPLHLPWGSSAAFRFMRYIDPTLDHDLASKTKPWALSPLVSTMPHLAHTRGAPPPFPPRASLADDVSQLGLCTASVRSRSRSASPASSPASSPVSSPASSTESVVSTASTRATSESQSHTSGPDSAGAQTKKPRRQGSRISLSSAKARLQRARGSPSSNAGAGEHADAGENADAPDIRGVYDARTRRAHFADVAHRRDVVFGPEDVVTTDFCYGFMQFAPALSLQLPGGITFDLMRYWDGQPVRFVCCERKSADGGDGEGEDDVPWGRVFWCVAIELIED